MSDTKKVKLRKKDQVEEILTERIEQSKLKKESGDEWHKHWEKDKDPDLKSRKGGGKRPKPFNFDGDDDKALREQEAADRAQRDELKRIAREKRFSKDTNKEKEEE